MKKTLISLFLIGLYGAVNAQEHNKWLAGSIGYSSEDYNSYKLSHMTIGPEFGIMLNESLAAGVNLGYSTMTGNYESTNTDINTDELSLNLFLRKYKSLADDFALFAQLNLGYFSGNYKEESTAGGVTTSIENSYSGYDVNIKPGIQYWVYPRLSILSTIGELGYRTQTIKEDNSDDQDQSKLNISVNGNLSFGLVWHF